MTYCRRARNFGTLPQMRSVLLALLILSAAWTAGAQPERSLWPPAPVQFVDLSYPPAALDAGLAGRVIVRAHVDVYGHVEYAEALAGPPMLAAAAVENLQQWTYAAGTGDVYTVYRFEFVPGGRCNDNRRSLFQLLWSTLVVVSACNLPTAPDQGGVIPLPAYHEVEFEWRERLVYPPIAQSARVQGVVIINATYDRRGRVEMATAVSGSPLLVDGALTHARKLRFAPEVDREQRRSSWLVYEFNQVKQPCSAADFGLESTDYLVISECGTVIQPSVSPAVHGRR